MLRRRLSWVTLALVFWAAAPAAQSDLDTFMSQVLARRDENWKKLQQYVLEEEETFQLGGPDGAHLFGLRREYAWFPRDGFFIRSPLRADGVAISEPERRRAEDAWLRKEREREQRRAERDAGKDRATAPTAIEAQAPATVEDAIRQSVEPQFISSAYFLRFRFEQGHYALAGRETLQGRDVLRIEYYPTRLFADIDKDADADRDADTGTRTQKTSPKAAEREARIQRQMNKVALVTLWVEPAGHQILQYEFQNIDLDFLPGRQFFRLDELSASMRMVQPFPDVWLPDGIAMRFRATLAIGDMSGRYDVRYRDYRLASVTTRVR